LTRPIGRDYEARFWSKVDMQPGGCWEWTASRKNTGYGQFMKTTGNLVLAHRLAYELVHGSVPEGLHLDHLCRNRGCVNPAHLEPVTNRENTVRGMAGEVNAARMLAKTACKYGHPYTEANTRITPQGWRACRACARADAQRARDRAK
jgi:hypothetical protein